MRGKPLVPLFVQRLTETSRVPTRSTEFAAGLDLYADEDVDIPARGRALVKTGISVALDPGTGGLIWPRSGLATQYSVDTSAGVIDSDYRGEVLVLLCNAMDDDYPVRRGDRIAQLVIVHIARPPIIEVDTLNETGRGSGGFGSSGR